MDGWVEIYSIGQITYTGGPKEDIFVSIGGKWTLNDTKKRTRNTGETHIVRGLSLYWTLATNTVHTVHIFSYFVSVHVHSPFYVEMFVLY